MKTSFKKRSMVILASLALALWANGVTSVYASTFTVSNLNDSGAGSLRQAITDADASPGADTITFSVSGTITLESMLAYIFDTAGLTIDGTGQTVTIDGDGHQVLYVVAGASLTLDHLTITNGHSAIYGGAIWNDSGTLIITNSTFFGNSADMQGGAIHNGVGGTLSITNSTISGNSSTTWGGGISNFGTLMTLTNSTISGNSSANGGGIFNDVGTLTITNSTFSGNSANFGGGILNYGTLTMTNSTLSGNTAATNGGGIHSGGVMGSTGTLLNTIVADSPSGGNCSGTITNGGNNIDDGTTCGWGSADGSMSSTDPRLGALGDNGGPTQTFALLAGSPAIDGVTFNAPNSAPSTDQHGVARPQDMGYDIGAFESEGQPGPDFNVNTSADTDDGRCNFLGQGAGNQDCTLREAIDAANILAGANTITFSVGGTITLVSTLPNITDASGLTVDGIGQTVTISGDDLYQVVFVDAGASLTLDHLTIANGSNSPFGGGIENEGTLTITNTTFSGNNATAYGGGIYNSGTLSITNSTFSDNSSGVYGGALINWMGTTTITNSTFSGNTAGTGGVIYDNSGTVTLLNTIVADSPSGGNCSGTITNDGNNIDDGTTCGWGSTDGSMSSTDPLLGVLADNGGPTQTFKLLPGSPALDGVTFNAPNNAPSTDQRGVERPQGVGYDIGAFESETQVGPAYIVNTNADSDDGFCNFLGQGVGNQDCTLREAINAANAFAGANTITFSVSGTITLVSTLPNITDAAGLMVDGTGQMVTLSGDHLYQVLTVDAGASLTLDSLTIAHGNNTAGNGGGILNDGTLIVTNSTFSDNSTTDSGGAIYNTDTGTLSVVDSTFAGNSAGGGGGGIINHNTLSVMDSTFSSNSAMSGGAINNQPDCPLTMTNITLSENSAVSFGGGTANFGALTVTNSTFSGNGAGVGGGGIFRGDVTGSTVTLHNTIVANSTSGGNCGGTIINGGNNIDDGTTCGWGSTDGSMSSTDPLLVTLADNGGPTQTFELLTGSPAMDGVTFKAPNGAPSTDQRGVARPQGVRYDIGAYESEVLYWIFLPLILR